MEQKLEALENLLPGLLEYFQRVLPGEKLSDNAEKKRQFFVAEFDKLSEFRNPRRDSLPPLPPPAPPGTKASGIIQNGVHYDNTLQYDYADDPNQNRVIKADNFYEEPVPMASPGKQKTAKPESRVIVDDVIYEDTDLAFDKEEGSIADSLTDYNFDLEAFDQNLRMSTSSWYEVTPTDQAYIDVGEPAHSSSSPTSPSFPAPSLHGIDVPDNDPSVPYVISDPAPALPARLPRYSIGYDSDASGSYEGYESDEGEDNGSSGPSRQSSNKSTSSSQSDKAEKKRKVQEMFASHINDPAVRQYGILHQKRLMGTQWAKRFCLIRNMRFIAYSYKLAKEEKKVVIDFPLVGFDVIYSQKEGKRSHVLKIFHPGIEKYMFAVGRKEEAQKWLDVLIECSKASEGMEGSEKVPGSPLSRTDSTSSDVTDRKLVIGKTADGLEDSTGSKKDEMFDNIPSPTRGDMSPRIAKKHLGTNLADSLAQTASSLLAFARNKKGKKKSPTSPGASDIPRVVDTNTAISGYLNVCSGKLSDGKWNKSWCLIKDGMFKCYRVNSEKFEFQLHLQGCDLQPVPDGKKKAKCYLFQLVQAKESVLVAEAYDLDEMARWIRTLIKEIDSIDENLMGDYVEPEETMEFFKKIVRGQDGEVLTQKDIVAKNMKIFEKMENKPAGGAKMQDQNKKGGVIRRLQEQLIESSKTGNNTAQQSRDRNVTERQNSTDNSFLDKVRIQRRLSQVHRLKSQFERLQVEKAHLNRMLSDLRSHKLELKDKKLQCREQSERKKIDNIMKDTDLEISQTEDELQQVNLQLDKISNQIDDAEDEVAVCMETVHGEDEEDDEFYDCHVFEKDINNSQSKEQNNQQTSKQAVLQRAKMWESMAKQ